MTTIKKQSTMRDYYQSYLEHSFSAIPEGEGNDYGIVRRQVYHSRKPTDSEYDHWIEECPHTNIGIITGKISNLLVIEVYSDDQLQSLQDLTGEDCFCFPTVKTPSGYQFYFLYPGPTLIDESVLIDGFDIHSDSGYVLAPPSIDENEGEYTWITTIEDAGGMPEVPEALLLFINDGQEVIQQKHNNKRITKWRVPEGKQNAD